MKDQKKRNLPAIFSRGLQLSPAKSVALAIAGAALAGVSVLSLLERRTRGRYLAERRLRREQEVVAAINAERFQLASEAVNGLIYDWDVATGTVLRTRGLMELIGYTATEDRDTEQWWMEQIHPEDRPKALALTATVHDPGKNHYEAEYRVRHKEGRYIHLQDRGLILRNREGKPLRVVGCSIDMSARYQFEEALRQSEERLRLAVTGADLGTWHWNLRIDAVELSEHARRLFGVEEEGTIDSKRLFGAIPEEDREWVWSAAQLAIEQRQDFDVEHRVLWPDGTYHWLAVRGHAYYGDSGAPLNMEGIALDVTERYRALSEIEQLNVRLQRAMAESHHRIKNNLQTLVALAEIQTLNAPVLIPKEALERLCQHIRTLATLHDLLTLEIREFREVETVSVQVALERLLELLKTITQNRTVNVRSDDMRIPLKQAGSFSLLVNELVSNAVKHGQGEIDITVRIIEGTMGNRRVICLEVEDRGPGFSVDFNASTAANTGLELVESIGRWDLQGEIYYQNRDRGGARVRVTFPLAN